MDTSTLRKARLALRFSQAEFATLLVHPMTGKKVTLGTIRRWEQDKTNHQVPVWVDDALTHLEVTRKRALALKAPPKPKYRHGETRLRAGTDQTEMWSGANWYTPEEWQARFKQK